MAEQISGEAAKQPVTQPTAPIDARAEEQRALSARAETQGTIALSPDLRPRWDLDSFLVWIGRVLRSVSCSKGLMDFSEIIGDPKSADAAEANYKADLTDADKVVPKFADSMIVPRLYTKPMRDLTETTVDQLFTLAESCAEGMAIAQSIFPSDDDLIFSVIGTVDELVAKADKWFTQMHEHVENPTVKVDDLNLPSAPVPPIPASPFPPDSRVAAEIQMEDLKINANLDDQLVKIHKFSKDILKAEADEIRREVSISREGLKVNAQTIVDNFEGLNNILPTLVESFVLGGKLLLEKSRQVIIDLSHAIDEPLPFEPDVEGQYRRIIAPIFDESGIEFKLTSSHKDLTYVMRLQFFPESEEAVDFIDDTLGTAATEVENDKGVVIVVDRKFDLVIPEESADISPGPPPTAEQAAQLTAFAGEEYVIGSDGILLTEEDVVKRIEDREIDTDAANRMIGSAEFAKDQDFLEESGIKVPSLDEIPAGADEQALKDAMLATEAAIVRGRNETQPVIPHPFPDPLLPARDLIPTRG